MAAEVHHAEHIPQWKQDEIDNIKKLIQSHKVFGMVAVSYTHLTLPTIYSV